MTTQIYLLTPPQISDLDAFASGLDAVCGAVQIAALQIRLKQADKAELRRVFEVLAPIARKNDTIVIINDDPHLAQELGADGVHLGQNDMAVKAARKLLGPNMVIGITAHNSRHLAMLGGEAGADYVAFGAFYPSATKKTDFVATTELLSWWSAIMEIPCVAIGGITVQNAGVLAKAGTDFVALSAGIWDADDQPVVMVRQLAKILMEN
ncbi:Thiamin-phosphate pyrophosphorylase [hydrothermal vent metagenome]|uniref:thiamine phosphate synthase n=1 Tax=hydrothermal vent metagenome TaxID=652676 RepID=A0A3B0RVY0_9ZZZZ